MRLLLVCTGNICRSPMAEAIARRLLESRGREDVAVASAGTAAQDGAPASEGAYLIALESALRKGSLLVRAVKARKALARVCRMRWRNSSVAATV